MRFGTQFVADSDEEDLAALRFAGKVSIVLIYLPMAFLFESRILPLSIILTVPLASIGVGWLHFATGRDIDFLGVVGGILLVGVVVNNGIVLIDYVTRLRSAGHQRPVAPVAPVAPARKCFGCGTRATALRAAVLVNWR